MNHIFYLMGKSSSGKDTIYSRILKETGLIPIVLYTTRPIRDSEHEGVEYHFVDDDRFNAMRDGGEVIEWRTYDTKCGKWTYYTASDSLSTENGDRIGIGTLQSYLKIRDRVGDDVIVPVYIEVDDDIRFLRAVEREKQQSSPKYAELCRRFLADNEDFSDEKLSEAGITRRFENNGSVGECLASIKKYITGFQK
ncbi:MAG: guanylate kinase [Ruminococcus sp.]|uniref:guanylate kinase n=1 Tax=Ruminococcus flavefaciens TaxID=1265 RepID=UPI0026F20B7B|nr:guanylate kinase [Ruminococcus flavefaciens]MBR0511934.1 guanylate kinase [Ruminococcus sp.]